jgi:hypothetical protein
MQAAVYHGPRDIRVEDIPTPSPAATKCWCACVPAAFVGWYVYVHQTNIPGSIKHRCLLGRASTSVAGAYYGAQLGSPEDPATAAHNVEIVAT